MAPLDFCSYFEALLLKAFRFSVRTLGTLQSEAQGIYFCRGSRTLCHALASLNPRLSLSFKGNVFAFQVRSQSLQITNHGGTNNSDLLN